MSVWVEVNSDHDIQIGDALQLGESRVVRKSSAKTKKLKVPMWASEYLNEAVNAHDKLMQITRLSAQGISMHIGRPRAIRALHDISDEDVDEEKAEKLRDAESDAELAQQELGDGFPVLHGLVTIAVWSWMEDLVKGMVANWFLKRPSSMRAAPIQKLKVRLGEYIRLTKAEQALFLVELLEQDLASPLKKGANRFNSLLEVVGLTVKLTDEEGRALFELQHVRNNLAHRNGRVDARLASECPWLGLKPGERLKVSQEMLHRYSGAAGSFMLKLIYCVGDAYGLDVRPEAVASRAAAKLDAAKKRRVEKRSQANGLVTRPAPGTRSTEQAPTS